MAESRSILDLLEKSDASADVRARARDAAGGVVLISSGDDPFLLLPDEELEIGPRRWAVLDLTLAAWPAPGPALPEYPHATLYYRLECMKQFKEDAALSEAIVPDGAPRRVSFTLRLPYAARLRGLRLDPANFPGWIAISEATVRWEERPRVPAHREAPIPAPVLTGGRTGGTLLMKLLSLHPDVMVNGQRVHEAWVLSYFAKFYEMVRWAPMQGRHEHLMRNLENVADGGVLGPPIGFQEGIDLEEFRNDFRAFLDRYLPKLLATAGWDRWETALYYSEKIDDSFVPPLLELFPEAKVLVLFRDPRKVYLSIKAFELKNNYRDWSERARGGNRELIRTLTTSTRRKLDFAKSDFLSNQFLRLRYEDVIREPGEACRRICAFLELPGEAEFRAEVERYLREAESSDFFRRHQTSGSLSESLRASWDGIAEEERETFLEDRNLFEELGYAA